MTDIQDRIRAYRSVSLEDLVTAAALLTRIDRKYLLWRSDAEELLAELPAGSRILETDGMRVFDYESVYFDTPELLSYQLAAHGRRRRFKLRTRAYLDSGTAFLEVKTKSGRSATVKERIEYELDERTELTDEARDYATEALAGVGVAPRQVNKLEPVVTTRYHRATVLQPDGASRATIDTDLVWHDDAGRVLALDELVIIETKSSAHASALDRLLWSRGHRPQAVSKFATGMAALHPELPSNKWNRQLHTYFLADDSKENRR